LALCPEHGFVRGKIRMKSNGENFFVVKTMKIVGKEKAQELYEKREDTRKKRSERNRLKRLREKVKGKR
jgi:exonuclease RNase T and DNA polymerase III